MKVLVAYDGTLQSKAALKFGAEKVKEKGGEVLALHIFNNTLFLDYDVAGAAEAAKREAARQMEEAKLLMGACGVKATFFSGEGDPEEETIRFATERNVDVLLCPPRYKATIKRFRKMAEDQGRQASEDTILDGTERMKMAVLSVR